MSQAHAEPKPDTFIPRYWTPEQVAQRYQLPLTTVQQYAREGKLPAVRMGKHWRFPIEELERLGVEARKEAAR